MPDRPNLIFILTDQQRADTLAAYGNTRIEMPNLNRLAEQSTVFERAYVTQPLCTPARSSIHSGLYPHSNGCGTNDVAFFPGVRLFAEMLDGYHRGHHGKWHLGNEIFRQGGFDEWVATEDYLFSREALDADRDKRSPYHRWLIEHGARPSDGSVFSLADLARVPEELSRPAYLAQEAIRFIRENRERPFALFINPFEPHGPYHSARDGQYDPADIPLPPTFDMPPGEGDPVKSRVFSRRFFHCGHADLPLRTEADWRRLIANYWGLCSLVDAHMGRVLDAVDDEGLRDNTIVVFTSDHGDMMGSHRLLTKGMPYEEAVRVPLLVRMPGQTEQRRVAGPMSQIDLVPTLLDLMGQSIPDGLEGDSVAGAVRGEAAMPSDDAVIEWQDPNGHTPRYTLDNLPPEDRPSGYAGEDALRAEICDATRTVVTADGWKFNCSALGKHELFDLNADPYETRNLAADACMAGCIRATFANASPPGSGERTIQLNCPQSDPRRFR